MCYARKVHSYTFRLFHYVYCVRWNKYIFFSIAVAGANHNNSVLSGNIHYFTLQLNNKIIVE